MKTSTQAEERGTTATPSFTTPFNRTAAGAAVLGAVFTLPVAVDAAIVYSGVQNIHVTLPSSQRHASNNTNGLYFQHAPLDIDGNAGNDFYLRVQQERTTFGSSSYRLRGVANLDGLGGNLVRVDGFEAVNFGSTLAPSNAIGPFNGQSGGAPGAILREAWTAVESGSLSGGSAGHFADGVTGVAGVKFYRAETGQNHYGWIRLVVDEGNTGYPYRVTAIDWAWETTPETPFHEPFKNPEIPEANPGLILLAAGGTGLAAWRLCRRQAAKAAAQA